MSKKKGTQAKEEKIKVLGTKEGKLYIETSDLFALESVKELLKKIAKSKALDDVKKVRLSDR